MQRPPDDSWREDLADPQTAAQGVSRESYVRQRGNMPRYINIGEEGLNAIRQEKLARAREWDERKRQLSLTAWRNQLQFVREQLALHESNRAEPKSMLELTALVVVPQNLASINHFLNPLIKDWTFPQSGTDLRLLCKELEEDSDYQELFVRVTSAARLALEGKQQLQSAVKLFAIIHEITGRPPKWSIFRRWLIKTINNEHTLSNEVKHAYFSLARSAESVANLNDCSVKEAFSVLMLESYIHYCRLWVLNTQIARQDSKWISHPALEIVFGAVGMSGDPLHMVAATASSSWKASGLRHGPWSTVSVAQYAVLAPVVDSIEPFGNLYKYLTAPLNVGFSEWLESLEEASVLKGLPEHNEENSST